jgi:hypothetical protein
MKGRSDQPRPFFLPYSPECVEVIVIGNLPEIFRSASSLLRNACMGLLGIFGC